MFGLPRGLTEGLASKERLSEFLDGALFFQVVGYFLGILLITYMVRKLQKGDWSTLGISWDGQAPRELLAGAGFGALLIACFLPLSFVLAGGQFEVDGLVRLLIGSSSGLGLVLAAVVVVIGAPVIEEIYYRGILYEKLARRHAILAVVVTTLLFTAAHGALFIPAILFLGLGLAWQRRTKGLWYTMGAHAAWNLAVIVMAAFVVVGGSSFSPADGAYEIQLPRSWERIQDPSFPMEPGVTLDLAATTSSGSSLVVVRVPARKGSAVATAEKLLAEAGHQLIPGATESGVEPHDHLFDEGAESAHVAIGISQGGVDVATHFFVMVRPGSSTALVFNLTCQREMCQDDGSRLDEALHQMDFGPAL